MIQHTTHATPRADLGVAFHEFATDEMTFVAEQALPVLNVPKEAATIGVVARENARLVDNKHANGGTFGRVHLTTEDKAYSCSDYGLEGPLTDRDREFYADDYDAEVETVGMVKTQMQIAKEVRVAAELFDPTTNFPSGTSELYTDVSSAPWDAAGSDVLGHVCDAVEQVRKNTGVRADTMLIGPVTYKNLKKNTGILAKFVSPGVVTAAIWKQYLAEILDLREILVADGVYNSAKEGQSFAASDIWSDDYALIYKKSRGGSMASPGLGRTLRWVGPNGSLMSGNVNEVVVTYREEQTESDVFRVREYVDELIADAYFGHLLKIDA